MTPSKTCCPESKKFVNRPFPPKNDEVVQKLARYDFLAIPVALLGLAVGSLVVPRTPGPDVRRLIARLQALVLPVPVPEPVPAPVPLPVPGSGKSSVAEFVAVGAPSSSVLVSL